MGIKVNVKVMSLQFRRHNVTTPVNDCVRNFTSRNKLSANNHSFLLFFRICLAISLQ